MLLPCFRGVFAAAAVSIVCLTALFPHGSLASPKVLIIRGGPGTGGVNSPNDNQLSDIFNTTGNSDWVDFRLLLESQGYTVEQMIEGGVISTTDCTLEHGTPLDLAGMDLGQYDIIVFGSNNARYDQGGAAHIDAVEDYVLHGGAALFISDANWGRSWDDAPSSEQPFLDRFGLIMNQDRGTYAVSLAQGDFVAPAHPILAGVSAFDGEGVSPIRFSHTPPGMKTSRLVTARGGTRDNDGSCGTSNGQGTNRATDASDCALVVVEAGLGRVAGHFDRNTFFSTGGAGTELGNFDNTPLAINLFSWLCDAGSDSYASYAAALTGPDGFLDDGDGDALQNGMEYALGIDGNDGTGENGAAGLPTVTIAGSGGAARLQFDFAMAAPPRGDLTLRVEAGGDLGSWTVIAEKIGPAGWTGPAAVAEGAVTDGRRAISVEDIVTTLTASRRFARLVVEWTIAD